MQDARCTTSIHAPYVPSSSSICFQNRLVLSNQHCPCVYIGLSKRCKAAKYSMAESAESSTEGNTRGASESRADSKTAPFSEEEEDLVTRMYKLVGDRWSLIAGRIPGRTASEIKIYWNTKHSSENCSVGNITSMFTTQLY